MAPFMNEKDGKAVINWMRLIELALIVAFNIGAIIAVMRVQISDLKDQFKTFTSTVSAAQIVQDGRINQLEINTALCMDRLDSKRRGN